MDRRDQEATLRLAAERGQGDAVEVMLSLGVDCNAADPAGRTALHLAAAEGHGAVVELLLARGAEPSLLDVEGRSALDLALRSGFGEAAAALEPAP